MRRMVRWAGIGVLVAMALLVLALNGVQASPAQQNPTPQPTTAAALSDEECLACHRQPDQIKTLPSGDQLYLTIDADAFHSSLHGSAVSQGKPPVHCTSCHTDITGYPHPELTAQNQREIAASFSESCKQCHAEQYEKNQDSVHARARAEGNENAAVCSDCHGSHDIRHVKDAKSIVSKVNVSGTCGKCHEGELRQFSDSAHRGVLASKDSKSPTCVGCHGSHNIVPGDSRKNEAAICLKCHLNNQEILSTNSARRQRAEDHNCKYQR